MSTAAPVQWKGAAALAEFIVPIESVTLHPANPRRGRIHLIAESLERWGQIRPILVNKATGQIVAGNHTTLAARELGWTHIAVVSEQFDSEESARDYLLADNRLPELGDYDREQLLALLGEVEASDAWAGTGYTADDLEDLRAMNDAIPETAPEQFRGGFALDAETLAARAQQLAGGRAFDEVVLVFDEAGHTQFQSDVKILRKEWALDGGVTEAVTRACESEALRLNQDGGAGA